MNRLRILTILAVPLSAFAQSGDYFYTAVKSTSLTAATEVVTVQQPASGARNVFFDGVSVYCSTACDFTIERDGTAATGTALTVTKVNDAEPSPTATAFHTSDVGAGAASWPYSIASAGSLAISLKDKYLIGSGTTKNVSVRIASMTGTVKIIIKWKERAN